MGKEHSAIQSTWENRLNRLRETLNNLMSRYSKLDQKYKQENTELTEEYKRLTKQFKDLQEKFHHFEQADEKKFREVWELNEQELGLEWAPPKEDQLLQELETFSESGTATG